MKFDYRLSRQAERTFARLEPGVRRRVVARLDEISLDPFDPRTSKELTNRRGSRSARVGGYRIVFWVDLQAGVVLVEAIGVRGQVYRGN